MLYRGEITMIKTLKVLSTLIFILTVKISNAQENPSSLLDEISYVYIEKLIAVAKENYPKLKAQQSRIKIAESRVNSTRLNWLSPLSLSYVYSPANTLNLVNPTFFSGYQVGLSLNLGTVLQNPGLIRESKKELEIAKYDLDDFLLTLETEVKTRYFSYLRELKVLKLNSQNNFDARTMFTAIKYKFEKGEVAFEEYNNAASGYARSNQEKIDSEVAVLTAKASLEELLGVKLEEVPN